MANELRGEWVEDLDEEDEEIMAEVWAEIAAEEAAKKKPEEMQNITNENSTIARFERSIDRYLYNKWITIGGHQEGGAKHKGGMKVEIDEKGNIAKGPKAMEGKNIKSMDKNVAGTKKDERKKNVPPAEKREKVEVDDKKTAWKGKWKIVEKKDGLSIAENEEGRDFVLHDKNVESPESPARSEDLDVGDEGVMVYLPEEGFPVFKRSQK